MPKNEVDFSFILTFYFDDRAGGSVSGTNVGNNRSVTSCKIKRKSIRLKNQFQIKLYLFQSKYLFDFFFILSSRC